MKFEVDYSAARIASKTMKDLFFIRKVKRGRVVRMEGAATLVGGSARGNQGRGRIEVGKGARERDERFDLSKDLRGCGGGGWRG